MDMDVDMDLVPTIIGKSLSFDELADLLLGGGDDCFPKTGSTAAYYPESGNVIDDINLVNQLITPPSYDKNNDIFYDESVVKTSVGTGGSSNNVVIQEQAGQTKKKKRKEETEKKKEVSSEGGKTRRRRHPDQVQDHIVAERKRRELLSHMFISLSSMIPGLKKMDKATILGEAIKHMKHLKEKVKKLEVETAQLNATNKSVVVIKSYQLPVDDDDDNDDDNGSSSTLVNDTSGSGASGGSGGMNNNNNHKKNSLLPEIEVKISDNTLLLKVYCEKRKGILSELTAVLDGHDDLSITSCVVIPFNNFILNITIVAQMEVGFNFNVKSLVRTLRSTLCSTSP